MVGYTTLFVGKVNFKLWWFKAEVLRYLGTIQASVTVCEECARFVYAWKVLKVEFLVFLKSTKANSPTIFPKLTPKPASHYSWLC